jgi:hypothetical protein
MKSRRRHSRERVLDDDLADPASAALVTEAEEDQ